MSGDEQPGAYGDSDGIAEGVPIEPDFLSELAGAMRDVAARERDRLTSRAADDAAAEIAQARASGEAEADSLRQASDADVAGIEAWAEAAIERIRSEAASRVGQRQAHLETQLAHNESVVDSEVEAIEEALAGYGESLATFMSELDEIGDPTEIARLAGQLPARPDLAHIRERSRAAALGAIASESESAADAELASLIEAPSMIVIDTTETTETTDIAETAIDIAGAPIDTEGTDVAAAVDEVAAEAKVEIVAPGTEPASLVGVMSTDSAPAMAAKGGANGWETHVDPVAQSAWENGAGAGNGASAEIEPGAMDQDDAVIPTSAAVRLIRTVAPWTAPANGRHDPD